MIKQEIPHNLAILALLLDKPEIRTDLPRDPCGKSALQIRKSTCPMLRGWQIMAWIELLQDDVEKNPRVCAAGDWTLLRRGHRWGQR